MRSRRKRESRKRQSAGEDTAGCGNGSSTCQYLGGAARGAEYPFGGCVFPFSLPTLTAEVKPLRLRKENSGKTRPCRESAAICRFFRGGRLPMPAQSPEEQAFSKASQASCSLPSLRETAPRMFHTRYDLSSRRKASSRSLRAPAVFPCWSRQIPRERYASAEGSIRMAFVRSSKASSAYPSWLRASPRRISACG